MDLVARRGAGAPTGACHDKTPNARAVFPSTDGAVQHALKASGDCMDPTG